MGNSVFSMENKPLEHKQHRKPNLGEITLMRNFVKTLVCKKILMTEDKSVSHIANYSQPSIPASQFNILSNPKTSFSDTFSHILEENYSFIEEKSELFLFNKSIPNSQVEEEKE